MNKKELGERMAKIRLAKGESARSVSLTLGKGVNYIVQAENGRVLPPLDVLEEFCEYFGVPLAVLIDPNFKYPEKYSEILAELNKLTSDELDNILSIARALNKNKK